jgi:hypothetical protein
MAAMTDRKSPIEQAIDLFFYAPLGLLLNAEEVVPQLIDKGRQQVTMARMFGQFAVQQGQTEAGKAVSRLQNNITGPRRTPATPATADGAATTATSAVATAAPATQTSAPVAPPAPAEASVPAPTATALAIPDYDSLSASQVVPRLEGLATAELDEVRAYEAAHRGRKTILNKIAQLQG